MTGKYTCLPSLGDQVQSASGSLPPLVTGGSLGKENGWLGSNADIMPAGHKLPPAVGGCGGTVAAGAFRSQGFCVLTWATQTGPHADGTWELISSHKGHLKLQVHN